MGKKAKKDAKAPGRDTFAPSCPDGSPHLPQLAAAARLMSPLEHAKAAINRGRRHWPIAHAQRTAAHHADAGSEDRQVSFWVRNSETDEPLAAFLTVLDGHGGADAAQEAIQRIPPTMLTLLAKGVALGRAVDCLFRHLEESLQKLNCQSGTCANLCILAGPWVWCANLGDCRAAYVEAETLNVVWLSKDHQASDPDERKRIEAAGGKVEGGRVDCGTNTMEPSRTLGDFDFKVASPGVVSSTPEQRAIDLRECSKRGGNAQGFVVVGSDGLWKHVPAERLSDVIERSRGYLKVDMIDEEVCRAAVAAISQDLLNCTDDSDDVSITVACVDLVWGEAVIESESHDATICEMWGLEALVDGRDVPLLGDPDVELEAI